jgi:hypothetical protein
MAMVHVMDWGLNLKASKRGKSAKPLRGADHDSKITLQARCFKDF